MLFKKLKLSWHSLVKVKTLAFNILIISTWVCVSLQVKRHGRWTSHVLTHIAHIMFKRRNACSNVKSQVACIIWRWVTKITSPTGCTCSNYVLSLLATWPECHVTLLWRCAVYNSLANHLWIFGLESLLHRF